MRRRRSGERLPEHIWDATVRRVRAEFDEMPCLRVSYEQAKSLFGLPDDVCQRVLSRLESDGFLGRTSTGEFVRQMPTP